MHHRSPIDHRWLLHLIELVDRTDPSAIPEAVLRAVLERLGLSAGWIAWVEEEPMGAFSLAAAMGLPPVLEAEDRALLRWAPCRCQRMALGGELSETMHLVQCERLERAGIRAEHVTIPLHFHARLYGVMNLLIPPAFQLDEETRRELNFAGLVCGLLLGLTRALDQLRQERDHSAQLLERAQHQAQELATLNRALSEALRVREEMIQNVSHELRTPLAVAMGYLELLAENALGPLNPEQKEAITISRGRLEDLRRYVELLLTLQAARAGTLARIPIDLKHLVGEVLRRWRTRLHPERYAVEVQLPEDDIWLIGDPEGLARAIGEVLDNAIKFSPGGGRIWISLGLEEGHAVLRVQDEGIGIPPDRLERIGEPFYQVDGGTTRRFRGMGIGLAVARSVAEAHGGKLNVQPRAPRGTEVILVLPLARSAPGSEHMGAPKEERPQRAGDLHLL